MNKMSFAAWILKNGININDPLTMHEAMKKYRELSEEYEDEIWYVDMAAKYFEIPEESWDGWDWAVYEDGGMLADHSFPTAPWHIFQKNPLTGEMWAPSDDVAEVICEWGLVGRSANEKNAFLHDVHIPGYNHGWDEVALAKEQCMKNLHAWGLRAWAENFYEDIRWTYEVLSKHDRIEGLLEWARSLPEETDPDVEWSEKDQKKALVICDFVERIQEMINNEDYSFDAFPTALSTFDVKDATYAAYDANATWHYVAYYTGVCLWHIDYAGDQYHSSRKGWMDNKVPSKEIESFAVKSICMEYAELFGLLK